MTEQSNKVDDIRKKFNEGKNQNQILQPKPSAKFEQKPKPAIDNQMNTNIPVNSDWDAKDYMGSFEVPEENHTYNKYPKNTQIATPEQDHTYNKYPKNKPIAYGNITPEQEQQNYSKYPNQNQNQNQNNSYGNLPTPENNSYGNLPTPENKSYGNLPTPENKSYGNLPTPTEMYGNLPATYGSLPKPEYEVDDNVYDKPEVKSTRGILLKKRKKATFCFRWHRS